MKFHSNLNPKLWGENRELLPEVKEKLKQIAKAFEEYLDIPADAVVDCRILGSNCNYNYTKFSDLDLHLIVDLDKVHKDCPVVEGYLWAMKSNFNREHDITIHGIPVEVYAEPVDEGAKSNGVYSLRTGWIKEPEKISPTDNDRAVKTKYEELKTAIEKVNDSEEAADILKQIYHMRRSSLEAEGEFSTENIAFKLLRNSGLLSKLRDIIKKDVDKELTLESLKEDLEGAKMDITELIARLIAIQNFAKDIHYNSFGPSAYAKHLLADVVGDDWNDFIDDIKENMILGRSNIPLPSKVYLEKAIAFIPNINMDVHTNFMQLRDLISKTNLGLAEIETHTKGEASLLDGISEKLDKANALLFLQTHKEEDKPMIVNNTVTQNPEQEDDMPPALPPVEFVPVKTNEEIDKDHEAATETPIDREEVEVKELRPDPIAAIGQKYDEENLLVAEESTLDRLARKLKDLNV